MAEILKDSLDKLQLILDKFGQSLGELGFWVSVAELAKSFPIGTILYLQRNTRFPGEYGEGEQEVMLMGTAGEVVNHEVLDDISFLHILMPTRDGSYAIYRQSLPDLIEDWSPTAPVDFAQHLDNPIL